MSQRISTTILGFDIGGTKTAIVEGAFDGSILQRIAFPTRAEVAFENTFPEILLRAKQVCEKSNAEGRQLVAISVSIGGPLNISDGFLINPPHLPGWHQISLTRRLEDAFPGLPVFVEHDGNAGALAEFYFGIGQQMKDLKHLIFLTFGTGLGAGIIVNGELLRGVSYTAGEVGHWRLSETGPIGFGKTGSWEAFASGAGLVALARMKNAKRWRQSTTIREVVDDMLSDDEEALEVAAEAGKWMGRGIALLVDVLNPQAIVLGTLGVVLEDRILEPVRKELQAEALPQARDACTVRSAVLGRQIGDVASLMAAIHAQRE